ncbi:hypothetical protein [Marinilabilia rubra]|uniref:hypothetical protein n=1 Tax=Marinilabilia rubra TaxID=2162893 RepID=UPI001304C642|nr:hypothetical protein [Marinilabilia rubra]
MKPRGSGSTIIGALDGRKKAKDPEVGRIHTPPSRLQREGVSHSSVLSSLNVNCSVSLRLPFVPPSELLRSCFVAASVALRLLFVQASFPYKRRITEEQPKKHRICPEAVPELVRTISEAVPNNYPIEEILFSAIC